MTRKIGNKLPSALKYAYNLYASLAASNATALEKLSHFFEIQAKLAIDGRIFDADTLEPYPVPSEPEKADKRATVCVICNRDNHKPANCFTLARENIQRRRFLVRQLRLSYKCLNIGHLRVDCKSKGCTLSSKPHHTLLYNQEHTKNCTDKKRSERAPKSTPQQTSSLSVNQA